MASPSSPSSPSAPPTGDLPPLDTCGFISVPADAPLWMTCDQCGKSDHFWLVGDNIRCRCGAVYGHALRPDGSQVPAAHLRFVPFPEGPRQLADLEWDPRRLGLGLVVVLALVAGGLWVWLT